MRRSATGQACGVRRAFTLVELLVVMTIIAVLIALSAAATLRFLGVQQSTNTKTTLTKVQGELDKQWAIVTDQAWKEPIPPAVEASIKSTLAGSDANANRRTRVIYIKLKQRQMFPMTYGEALNPAPLPPVQTYVIYLRQRGITAATAGGPLAHESAACLLMALQRNPAGGGVKAEDLGVSSVQEFPAGGTQTIPALVDAWKSPLIFARWPTGSTELNPSGPPPGLNDPVDPEGLLNPSWSGAAAFRGSVHDLAPAGRTYRLAPLVLSVGPDKKPGVNLTTLARMNPDADDNLFSSRGP